MGDIEQPSPMRPSARRRASRPAAHRLAHRRGACRRLGRLRARTRNPAITHSSRTLFSRRWKTAARPRAETGWLPQHLLLEDVNGRAARLHALLSEVSQPRRICLRSWLGRRLSARRRPLLSQASSLRPLHAGHRASASSSGPATDAREREALLLQAAVQVTERLGVSSLHVTFLTRDEWQLAGEHGLPPAHRPAIPLAERGLSRASRISSRALASRKRKAIRKERREALERRHRDRMGDGARPHRGALGRLLRLLHGHRLAQMGLALSDAGRASACSARPWPTRCCWCSPSARAATSPAR